MSSSPSDSAFSGEQMALGAGPSRIDIAYERVGESSAPAVLLIMGGGGQLIHWPDRFCQALAGRGFQVIRFDNRDAGRSTHLAGAPPANVRAALAGDFSSASYTLSEMAADAFGLLDSLGIGGAHVVGASMGGFIAQTMAIEQPQRVRSLVCMMSTTGDMSVGQPHPEILREVFSGPPPQTRDEVIRHSVRAMLHIGSPGYARDETAIADRAGLAYDRGWDLAGLARQSVASLASGDRTEGLRKLTVPALVIHGLVDRLCDPSGGRAIAAAIPNAELVLIDGMGHDLPAALHLDFANRIADFIDRAEDRSDSEMRAD